LSRQLVDLLSENEAVLPDFETPKVVHRPTNSGRPPSVEPLRPQRRMSKCQVPRTGCQLFIGPAR
jgi:hypothetical protein